MRNIFITIIILVVLVIVCCACQAKPQEETNGELNYDPKRHTIAEMREVFVGLPESIDDVEKFIIGDNVKHLYGGDCGVIVVCKVAGGSVNRITEPDSDGKKIYIFDHVVTPIEIVNIIFTGNNISDDISFKEGDIIYLREDFFYVTEETPEYLEYYDKNAIIATGYYYPLEKDKLYLIYGHYFLSEENSYNNKPLLLPGIPSSVYCLSDNNKYESGKRPHQYEILWQEAKDKYGSLVNKD